MPIVTTYADLSSDERYVITQVCVDGEESLKSLRWLSYRWVDRAGTEHETGPGAGIHDPSSMQPRAKAAVERLLRLGLVALFVLEESPQRTRAFLRRRDVRLEPRDLDTATALDVVGDDRNWNDADRPPYEVYATDAGMALWTDRTEDLPPET